MTESLDSDRITDNPSLQNRTGLMDSCGVTCEVVKSIQVSQIAEVGVDVDVRRMKDEGG
jgi:hypothetical protein